MTSQVKDSIEILKKAQEIDRELYLAKQNLEAIPEERAKLKQALEAEKSHLHQLEENLKKIQLAQKNKEGELAQKEANIKKLDGQLSQVKTNKEYSALQQEIAALKADNSLLEEGIIKLLDDVEAAQEEVKKEKDRLKEREKEYVQLENELIQKEKTLAGAIETLSKQRAEAVAQVPPDVKQLYDLVIQKKQGIALAKIKNENCGACQINIRPQLMNEVMLGQAVVLCENCSRILYFEV